MLIVYMFYHRICWFCFFCPKSCQLFLYKSDTVFTSKVSSYNR